MIYKTREVYKIVQNESELQDALIEGFALHWEDNLNTTPIDNRLEQIDTRLQEIDKKTKKKK